MNRVAKVLVRQRAALDELLQAGPLALSNLYHTYNPGNGTLDANANVQNVLAEIATNPSAVICGIVAASDPNGTLCGAIRGILGNKRATPFGSGSWYGKVYDPTLNGLVEVKR